MPRIPQGNSSSSFEFGHPEKTEREYEAFQNSPNPGVILIETSPYFESKFSLSGVSFQNLIFVGDRVFKRFESFFSISGFDTASLSGVSIQKTILNRAFFSFENFQGTIQKMKSKA